MIFQEQYLGSHIKHPKLMITDEELIRIILDIFDHVKKMIRKRTFIIGLQVLHIIREKEN